MAGTRSVFSFFAGVYEIEILKTFMLSAISAFAWNAIIIDAGMLLGNYVESIDYYLSTYSLLGTIITVIVILFFVIRYFYKKNKK